MATRRVIEFISPLADDLLFRRMSGEENLGRLYEYKVDLLSKRSDIQADDLLGQMVGIKLELPDSAERHYSGYITRFSQGGVLGDYRSYQATVRPWLWFLTRTADCRIFQQMTAVDIIKKIFDLYPVASVDFDKLSGSFRTWEYCVQYRESDFNFVSRLMEHEGIYYYFEHTAKGHKLVLANSVGAHRPVKDFAKFAYFAEEPRARPGVDYIHRWGFGREIRTGKYAATDYDFKRPSVPLDTVEPNVQAPALSESEVFDYPGGYVLTDDGNEYAGVRLEELQTAYDGADGVGNTRALTVGKLFTLEGYPRTDQNIEYLVTRSFYEMLLTGYEAGEEEGSTFSCSFSVIPSKLPFRAARSTPKPIVQGPQTAVVVGPSGSEIYVDKYSRVKVQFFWDRYGKKNEESSCWMRVSQPWAGKNWGFIAIPRIGQEVVVDFLEGDPDQPLITGRVYNGEQMPPYELPANMTQTGIKTRSSKGGSPANFNEIRFEDKKGSEQLFIHAEKNQDIEVENDETHWVGHDRKKTIDHDETTLVKHDRTETVGNNETITIGVNRLEKVGNNETIGIGVNRTETVGANETITIGANRTENVVANETISIGGNRTITVAKSETATVALQRTHTVGINETITVGAAQEITVGAMQAITVGASQTVTIGSNQTESIGSNESVTVGGNESRSVGGGRSTTIGKDDALKVANNLVINAGDSITIKTGDASIMMKKDGTIEIKGKDISLKASGKINAKASSDVVIKGSKIGMN
jgi:type VI secretion system secreted protein VgrG